MKMLFLLGIVALCAYLYITQTAQIAKETAAKQAAAAEAAEQTAAAAARQSTAPASPAPAPVHVATPPAITGGRPTPIPGDWMWQKATPEPKPRKR